LKEGKLKMDTKDTARDLLTQQRQQQEQRQESMLNRTHEELEQNENSTIDLEARERLTEQRQHQKHLEDSMLSRAEAESHS
jgi:hypothetical protein